MKAKLIKKGDEYILNPSIVGYKLSKQNCDEIFGVVDVEKLAEEHSDKEYGGGQSPSYFSGFEDGFNKAMELNKDKVFTIGDIDKAIEWATINGRKGNITHYDIDNFIKSLQQPTEIEVEIVTESMNIDEIREQGKGFLNSNTNKPKLDENGCLILKRKI
jgi:hypothetical protein